MTDDQPESAEEGEGPYTCIRCLSATWNDWDICDRCEEESWRAIPGDDLA